MLLKHIDMKANVFSLENETNNHKTVRHWWWENDLNLFRRLSVVFNSFLCKSKIKRNSLLIVFLLKAWYFLGGDFLLLHFCTSLLSLTHSLSVELMSTFWPNDKDHGIPSVVRFCWLDWDQPRCIRPFWSQTHGLSLDPWTVYPGLVSADGMRCL